MASSIMMSVSVVAIQFGVVPASTIAYIAITVGLVMAVVLFPLFFKGFGDFIDCLRYVYQPAIISMFRGETVEDFWGSLKIYVWLALSIVMGVATHYKLPQFFPVLKPSRTTTERRAELPSKPLKPEVPGVTVVQAKELPKVAVVSSNSESATQTVNLPAYAEHYDVQVGDTVEISALKPAISFRRAIISTMDEEQLTVRNGADSYSVEWKDLIRLRTVGGK